MKRKEPMLHTISATDARIRFGEVIRRAYSGQEHLIVEKDGIPVVVILSVPDYEEMRTELKLQRFERMSRAAGLDAEKQGLTEEALEQELEEIRAQIYHETYA